MPVVLYGAWPSPVHSAVLVDEAVRLGTVRTDGGDVWWREGRPAEGGRQQVVRVGPGGEPADVLPEGFSARTRVHEYGGGELAVAGGTAFFANDADQRLWRLDPGSPPRPLTPEPGHLHALRYADADVHPAGTLVACVREVHPSPRCPATDVVNDLVAVPAGGGEPVVVAAGRDFYAAPRWSPDGRRLAWLCWDHPDMPWDGTELWVADHDGAGGLSGARRLAGGRDESVSQPRWSPGGVLHWISDRSGWWNLYADDGGGGRHLAPMAAELGGPDWTFGQSSYTFLDDGRLVAAVTRQGFTHLALVAGEAAATVPTPFNQVGSLQPLGGEVVAIAASARAAPAVVAVDVATGAVRVLRSSQGRSIPAGAVSEARAISFPSAGGGHAHAFYYPPRLDGFEGPPGERPPLVVESHGGPTGAASPAFDAEVQFWTSRGFALVDVNYGGSTGYGRDYRRRLDGRWGIVDRDDCLAAVDHLVGEGQVDPERVVVRGGSAGGYTTLRLLTSGRRLAAGASRYGVADLEALAADTHKFESRYLDRLVGPYPERADLYRERSPVHEGERIAAPVLLLQGLEDRVVPPSQAEALLAALRARGLPFAYLTFEGEQHGFRQSATVRRAIEAELWFFARMLGFEPADDVEPVLVEGLPG